MISAFTGLEAASAEPDHAPLRIEEILKKCKRPGGSDNATTLTEREKAFMFDYLSTGDRPKRMLTNESDDENDS